PYLLPKRTSSRGWLSHLDAYCRDCHRIPCWRYQFVPYPYLQVLGLCRTALPERLAVLDLVLEFYCICLVPTLFLFCADFPLLILIEKSLIKYRFHCKLRSVRFLSFNFIKIQPLKIANKKNQININ